MASLSTELQNRFSSQYLINITNPQNTASSTIDTTRLNNAIADCVAYFATYAGETVDSAAPTAGQIAAAVPTIVELCQVYSGQLGWESAESSIRGRLEAYALVNSRDRTTPYTDSLLTPTTDTSGDRPAFDRKVFNKFVPGAPDNANITSDPD